VRRRALALAVALGACGDNIVEDAPPIEMSRVARSDDTAGCALGSPVLAADVVITATRHGVVSAHDRAGALRWQVTLPALTPGDTAWIAATPAVVGDRVVLAWQDAATDRTRHAHWAAVLDPATGALDPAYPPVRLAASVAGNGGPVTFNDATAFTRSALVARGNHVYVSAGNIQDIQPWHGWVFDLDLDAWRAGGDALAHVTVTTPEPACGPPGDSGSDDMICGGGIWAPSGPLLDGDDLWLPTGNGLLDLARSDYANTILRVPTDTMQPSPGCDAMRCASFSPTDPDPACLASCAGMFAPRLAPGQPALAPPRALCDGMTFLECYARLDLDLGASTPVIVAQHGPRFGVLPPDGAPAALFPRGHLGTMYDRLAVRPFCGTTGSDCTANWAGTMVTQPVVTDVAGTPLVMFPSFYFDATSPAGVLALAIDAAPAGGFALREVWSAPRRDSAEAVSHFREHTGRPALVDLGGTPHLVVVDPGPSETQDGILYAIDAVAGAIVGRGHLDGPGQKYILPVVDGTRVFVTSCDTPFEGPTHLEVWDLAPP